MRDDKQHPLIDPKTGGFLLPARAFIDHQTGEVIESTRLARRVEWTVLFVCLTTALACSVWRFLKTQFEDLAWLACLPLFCLGVIWFSGRLHNAIARWEHGRQRTTGNAR